MGHELLHERLTVRPGFRTLGMVSALANELRTRGFTPLIAGGPRAAEKVQGVTVRDERDVDPLERVRGFRSRRSPSKAHHRPWLRRYS